MSRPEVNPKDFNEEVKKRKKLLEETKTLLKNMDKAIEDAEKRG